MLTEDHEEEAKSQKATTSYPQPLSISSFIHVQQTQSRPDSLYVAPSRIDLDKLSHLEHV